MDKTILHVDINSYFATILQQENPYLRNKPVGVIKSEGRTCLIATSKEAKKKGVGTGIRKKEALKLCPDITLIPAAFERYLDTTKRMQKVFKSVSPNVYIYSLDEAFIDVSDCRRHLYPDVMLLGKQLQADLQAELGYWVTCNIGIANNRFLAKLASETSPKGSVLQVTEENKDALLASAPFKDVCGVGFALANKLARFKVTVPYQIRFIPQEELQTMFGPFWSKELLKIAYGEETHLLGQLDRELEHMRSVGRSITGYHLHNDRKEIIHVLQNLCIEIITKVRRMKLSGRNIRVSLCGREEKWSQHITLKTPIDHLSELIFWVNELYSKWEQPFPVIKFAVRLSLLQPTHQSKLLPDWQKQESVQKAMDIINHKYGLFTLHPANIPPKNKLIYPEVTGFLGDRTYQLSEHT